MNFIRKKIIKWLVGKAIKRLIGKEIKNAISDLNSTIEALQNAKNTKEQCLYYATMRKTQHGLCYYFSSQYGNKSDFIKDMLKISHGGYLFYNQDVATLEQAVSYGRWQPRMKWREASIELCKQRIAYLKKFI
jgi:hypothetical protein